MADNTLKFYENDAHLYVERTENLDMTDTMSRVLGHTRGAPRNVLDLGCGSGRDAAAFAAKGYNVLAVDGAKAMCDITAARGIPTKHATFQSFHAPDKSFQLIWAMASLLHVPWGDMPALLEKYVSMLEVEGIFYMSFKELEAEGIDAKGRYFNAPGMVDIAVLAEGDPRMELLEIWQSKDAAGRNTAWQNLVLRRKS